MSSGERPIGATKGKQPNTEALCQPPPPPYVALDSLAARGPPTPAGTDRLNSLPVSPQPPPTSNCRDPTDLRTRALPTVICGGLAGGPSPATRSNPHPPRVRRRQGLGTGGASAVSAEQAFVCRGISQEGGGGWVGLVRGRLFKFDFSCTKFWVKKSCFGVGGCEEGGTPPFLWEGAPCAVPALCPGCAKSPLFSTAGSHGSQGPEFCTPDAVLNGSCTLL